MHQRFRAERLDKVHVQGASSAVRRAGRCRGTRRSDMFRPDADGDGVPSGPARLPVGERDQRAGLQAAGGAVAASSPGRRFIAGAPMKPAT